MLIMVIAALVVVKYSCKYLRDGSSMMTESDDEVTGLKLDLYLSLFQMMKLEDYIIVLCGVLFLLSLSRNKETQMRLWNDLATILTSLTEILPLGPESRAMYGFFRGLFMVAAIVKCWRLGIISSVMTDAEFSGLKLNFFLFSYQLKLEDVVTFFFVQYYFAKFQKYRKTQRAAKNLVEQTTDAGARRITFGLNSVSDGVLMLRTLCDTETQRVFPNPAQAKEVKDLCKGMPDKEDLKHGPFLRASDAEAALRIEKVLMNYVSSLFCTGHVARDMGDIRTATATFYFGLTFETDSEIAMTAKADRKLRLLLIQEGTLEELSLDLRVERDKSSDESENKTNGYNYYRHRLTTLMKLKELIAEKEATHTGSDVCSRLLIGSVRLSVRVTVK